MWVRKDDLMYDKNNLKETIRYCQTHNAIFRGRNESDIEEDFWNRVLETAEGMRTVNLLPLEGKFEPIYNAWFIVDAAQKGYYPIEGDTSPGSHVINFLYALEETQLLKSLIKTQLKGSVKGSASHLISKHGER